MIAALELCESPKAAASSSSVASPDRSSIDPHLTPRKRLLARQSTHEYSPDGSYKFMYDEETGLGHKMSTVTGESLEECIDCVDRDAFVTFKFAHNSWDSEVPVLAHQHSFPKLWPELDSPVGSILKKPSTNDGSGGKPLLKRPSADAVPSAVLRKRVYSQMWHETRNRLLEEGKLTDDACKAQARIQAKRACIAEFGS